MNNQPITPLITLFNQTFIPLHQTELVCCEAEPIYRPADEQHPHHRIIFAHGFFSSALHEISHWCLAGKKRRLLEDFGYWYEPDGRSAQQQAEFENVEVKPQALEWIFSVASGHKFVFSADNLNGQTEISDQFKQKVWQQVNVYLADGLPEDANLWFNVLSQHYRNNQNPKIQEFML